MSFALHDTPPLDATPTEAHSKRLDVLFLLNNLAIGGSERKVLRLVARLQDVGLSTAIASLNGPHTLQTSIPAGVPHWQLGRTGKFSPAALWRLHRLVARHQPATLVSVNLYPSLYVLACAASLGKRRPGTVGLINSATFVQSTWRRYLYRALLPLLNRTVHGSQVQRASWVKGEEGAAHRSTVIYNGVDLERFTPGCAVAEAQELRTRLAIPPGRCVIGTVGRLARAKNQPVLLDALQRLRSSSVDAHLVLAGDGPLRSDLEARARDLGIASRVSFTGAVEDVRPALDLIDVFVLPSVETFSNAALEAMAMGKPVVLHARGGAREMIEPGVEGYVIEEAEMSARLAPLLAALCADDQRRAQLGAAARRRVERDFSFESMVENYLDLLWRKQS